MRSKFLYQIGLLSFSVCLGACSGEEKQDIKENKHSTGTDSGVTAPKAETIRELKTMLLKGYVFNKTVKLEDTVSCFIFSNQEQFEHYFSSVKTAAGVPKIDFKNSHVAGIVYQASKSTTEIVLGETTIKENQAIVNFIILKDGKQTKETNAFILFRIPNDPEVQSITFLEGGQTIYSYYFADTD